MLAQLCKWPPGILEKLEFNPFAKKVTPTILKKGPASCSEMLADVPCIVHRRWLFCGMLYKFANYCNLCTIYVGSA